MTGAIILLGDLAAKEEYITSLIQDKKIPSYYVTRFDEQLKIADAKRIVSIVSQKIEEDKFRLFVIGNDATIEAQNALLKTIEETSDNSIFVFKSESLLPTILSRSHIVNLSKSEAVVGDSIFLDELLNSPTPSGILLSLDNFFAEKKDAPFSELILVLREKMLKAENKDQAKRCKDLLRECMKISVLVKTNNLNSRLAAEKIFLNYFLKN